MIEPEGGRGRQGWEGTGKRRIGKVGAIPEVGLGGVGRAEGWAEKAPAKGRGAGEGGTSKASRREKYCRRAGICG